MDEVKIGWVGLGNHTQSVLYDTLRGLPARVVAVCDIDGEKAAAFAASHGIPMACAGFRAMGERAALDAVVCAANSAVHFAVAEHFATRGIPVFIEKTPCDTMAQARTLAALERPPSVWIMTGFNRRFAAGYGMAKEIIQRDAFGPPTFFASKFNAGPYASARYFLTNHLLHHLDLARWLVGELSDLRLRRVTVDAHRVGYHLAAVSDMGTLVSIESTSLQDLRYPVERLEVTGSSGGMVQVENMKSLTYQRPSNDKFDADTVRMEDAADALCWRPNLGFPFANQQLGNEDEMRHFISCVKGGKTPRLTFADTLKTMALMEQVLSLDSEWAG